MFTQLLVALCLMAMCVVIHAAGVASVVHNLRRLPPTLRFWSLCWLFVRLAGWMVLLHLAQISVWAFVYVWRGAISDVASGLYFSAVTYTTTGYGDVVLPPEWRLIGAVEALTGILMCGWSTGFFFAAVSRMFTTRTPPAAPAP
jgi:hypothetical protein